MKAPLQKMIRLFVLLLAAGLLLCGRPASAASAKITFNDPSCTVGQQVTVTVSVGPEVAGMDLRLAFDGSYLSVAGISGGTGNIVKEWTGNSIHINDFAATGGTTLKYSIVFNTLAVGKTTVTVSEADLADATGDPMELAHKGNSAVTINPKPAASSEARLSSLTMKPGTLEPAFSPDVYDYTLTVPYETTSLTLSYQTKDSSAKSFYNTYLNELKVGTTEFFIKVTAQDGRTEKMYNVLITRLESTQAPTAETEPQPSETESSEEESAAVSILSSAFSLTLVPMPEELTIPAGYIRDVQTAEGGTCYEVLIPEKTVAPDHFLVYGQKAETAEPELYVLDLQDGTLQRLSLREAFVSTPETEEVSTEADTSAPTTAETSASAETPEQQSFLQRLSKLLRKLPFLTILLAVGLAALAALIALLLVLRRRRRERQAAAGETPAQRPVTAYSEWKNEPLPEEWKDEPAPGEWRDEEEPAEEPLPDAALGEWVNETAPEAPEQLPSFRLPAEDTEDSHE